MTALAPTPTLPTPATPTTPPALKSTQGSTQPAKPDTADALPTTNHRPLLVALFAAGLVTFAQIYAPQTVLPHIAASLSITFAQAGLIISAGTLGLAAGVIPWVLAAPRIGWRLSLTIALILGTGISALSVLAPTLPLFLAARFVAGVALAAVPALALAQANALLPPHRAAHGAGVFIAGNAVGGVVGRLVSGVVTAQWSWQVGVLSVAAICAGGTAVFLLWAPRNADASHSHSVRLFAVALASPTVRRLCVQGFLVMGVFVTFYNYIGFRLTDAPLNVSHTAVAWMFSVFAVGTVASMGASRLTTRLSRGAVVAVASGVSLVGLALSVVPHVAALLVALILVTVGFFGAQSIIAGWASSALPQARRHSAALYTIAYYAGGSIVGWGGGIAFAELGWGAVVALTAVCAAASIGIALTMRGTAGMQHPDCPAKKPNQTAP
ncbi:MFS transporter [Jonesia quinghaiensis]|uniref:MFS transporter n=1 Tax=Jonesia quinghaiensis TaxID=262806 RepID=UPI0003FF8E56|nr:MFS transporter [Jonesia quinghaiensis]